MEKQSQKRSIDRLEFKARLPKLIRGAAFFLLSLTIILAGVGFYYGGKNRFRLKGMPAELSKEVVASVSGYERRETENGISKYYIRADRATTFSDNHQELENVYLEAYDETGEQFDKVSAAKGIYIPTTGKGFNAYFSGNVEIETRQGLKVKSEQIAYEHGIEIAESEGATEFSRENFSGSSEGAILRLKEKQIELLKSVELNSGETDEITSAKIKASHALILQEDEKAEFDGNVEAEITPKGQEKVRANAQYLTAFFSGKEISRLEMREAVEITQASSKISAGKGIAHFRVGLKNVELSEGIEIENNEGGRRIFSKAKSGNAEFENGLRTASLEENVEIISGGTQIKAQSAGYNKQADRFELKNSAEIIAKSDGGETLIRSDNAAYEQSAGKVFLSGKAEVIRGGDALKGDDINAMLDSEKKLRSAYSKGNAYLKQTEPRHSEIWANEMNAEFGPTQKILRAAARGYVRARAANPENRFEMNGSDKLNLDFQNGLPEKAALFGISEIVVEPLSRQEFSRASISAPQGIRAWFSGGNLSRTQSEGRTTIVMSANSPDGSNRKLVADVVNTQMAANGKDLLKASAAGNAQLFVNPLSATAKNYNTQISAGRFDCEFFEGNNAKACIATGHSKAFLVPMAAGPNRGNQTITANSLAADFDKRNQDIERFEASGNAKFNELDRTGLASKIVYTAVDGIIRLRGGEPIIFDSRARARAGEIDWDTRQEKSFLRGKAATTYYSQKQTNGATPFTKPNAPVFLTSERADFDHAAETGIYYGNARAWQDNNYVRAEKLILNQKDSSFFGEGAVQSLLYNAKRKEGGKESSQPVFASAGKIFYSDKQRYLKYEDAVDIRQAGDRSLSQTANIYLDESNNLRQMSLVGNVVLTQPKRRAIAEIAQYNAADDSYLLRGSPAKIEDSEQGETQGAELAFSSRGSTFSNQGTTKPGGSGRTRTVYKIKKQ